MPSISRTSELVWETFMRNPESARAMQLAGFRPEA